MLEFISSVIVSWLIVSGSKLGFQMNWELCVLGEVYLHQSSCELFSYFHIVMFVNMM